MESKKIKSGTVATCIALTVILVSYFFFNSSAPHGSASASTATTGSVSAKRFRKVAGRMARKGIRSRVAPNQVDVFHFYLPAPVASHIAPEDAKHLAETTREKLGSGATVYIMSPSGVSLADATP